MRGYGADGVQKITKIAWRHLLATPKKLSNHSIQLKYSSENDILKYFNYTFSFEDIYWISYLFLINWSRDKMDTDIKLKNGLQKLISFFN